MSKVVLLLSGGIDSTVLLYYLKSLGHEVSAVTFDYGQKNWKEIKMVKLLAEKTQTPLKIFKIRNLSELAKSSLLGKEPASPNQTFFVPGRNAIFLSLATAYAQSIGAEEVVYGSTLEDYNDYPDCRPEFVENFSKAMEVAYGVKVSAPFINKSKSEIVKIGKELGVDFKLTWSCYYSGRKHCGKCPACLKRKKAFEENGILDWR